MNKVELEIHALLLSLQFTLWLLTYQSTIDSNKTWYQKLSKTNALHAYNNDNIRKGPPLKNKFLPFFTVYRFFTGKIFPIYRFTGKRNFR